MGVDTLESASLPATSSSNTNNDHRFKMTCCICVICRTYISKIYLKSHPLVILRKRLSLMNITKQLNVKIKGRWNGFLLLKANILNIQSVLSSLYIILLEQQQVSLNLWNTLLMLLE